LTCVDALAAVQKIDWQASGGEMLVGGKYGRLGIAALSVMLFDADGAMAAGLDGKSMGLLWVLPFAGILLSIAVLPLWAPGFWHHHFGKVAFGWGIAVVAPFILMFGARPTATGLMHVMLLEYIPFIILILALFTVASGIYIRGNIHGSPVTNTVMLAIGTVLASFVGTTGASILMVRPMIRANDDRAYNAHVFIFFIFLVSNVGGALTPLGDPPLFLGFLLGIEFFWTLAALWPPTLLVSLILLSLFYVLDAYHYRKEGRIKPDPTPDDRIRLEGSVNFALLGLLIAVVLWSGIAQPFGGLTVAGVEVQFKGLVRDLALLAIAGLSLALTQKAVRAANDFSWGPVIEVAKLFAAIFVTIIPVIAILRAGKEGAMSGIIDLVTLPDGKPNDAMYFWLAGGLSSFLDNAPTYLVFFNAAGGDPSTLMGALGRTLMAISLGAVFMGANSYIGNAPNFMVKSIAEGAGIKMPSFFGYMAWSACFLIPCFLLVTAIWFR
jgi:Na+/H+ antiporter NhaD/arsenite permease-like protein